MKRPLPTYFNNYITDIDGNEYYYVTIGTQQWLVGNLKTTHYNDGTAIPNLIVNVDWAADTTGAYCWYDNDIANKKVYGALYNWYAVDNAHGLALDGWRIPSSSDYNTLIVFSGGALVAGGKLKEVGLINWNTPNIGAINIYDFTAVGGGRRTSVGSFLYLKNNSFYLTSIEFNATNSNFGQLGYNTAASATGNITKAYGMSVRCMRDI